MNLGHSASGSWVIESRMSELINWSALAHSAWSAEDNRLTSISRNWGYMAIAGFRARKPKLLTWEVRFPVYGWETIETRMDMAPRRMFTRGWVTISSTI